MNGCLIAGVGSGTASLEREKLGGESLYTQLLVIPMDLIITKILQPNNRTLMFVERELIACEMNATGVWRTGATQRPRRTG